MKEGTIVEHPDFGRGVVSVDRKGLYFVDWETAGRHSCWASQDYLRVVSPLELLAEASE